MSLTKRFRNLMKRVHDDEKGGESLETILLIGAIALPILIFLILVAWPRVKEFFNTGMTDLETGATEARQ